jgi:GNAT superfamily N-acetyltransferase
VTSVSEIEVVTTGDRPDLHEEAGAAFRGGWPEFIFHDPVAKPYTGRVEQFFGAFDILVLGGGHVAAGGWAVPLVWDGAMESLPNGYDGAMAASVTGHEQSVPPDTLSVMAAVVKPGYQGQGLAGRVLTALRGRATAAGLARVIAPVRPTLKSRYPLTPMADFATWTRGGQHLDPWIRAHQRLGATLLIPAPRSMAIRGTVAEWEKWTGMAFPQTGPYVVPDALDVVQIDCERDLGTYDETNLWMRHL